MNFLSSILRAAANMLRPMAPVFPAHKAPAGSFPQRTNARRNAERKGLAALGRRQYRKQQQYIRASQGR